MNCAQLKERLVDFLYEELPPKERAAFAEHMQGCPACQAEVASYQKTLGSARSALGGLLLEEPPARVQLAVLEAAKAAARPALARKTAREDEPEFFARLLRAPWLLPAFGAVSIGTVVFLVRVLKNPEVLPGQTPHAIEERALAPAVPPPAPERELAAQPAAAGATPSGSPSPRSAGEKVGMRGPASRSPSPLPSPRENAGRGSGALRTPVAAKRSAPTGGKGAPAAEEASRFVAKSKKADLDDLLSERVYREQPAAEGTPSRFAEPPPPRQEGAKKSSRTLDDLTGNFDTKTSERQRSPVPEPVAAPAKPAAHTVARAESAAAAVVPQASAPAAAPSPKPTRDSLAGVAANAPAPAAAQPTSGRKGMKQEEVVTDSAEVDDEPMARLSAKDEKAKASDKSGPSLDETVRKADRLYASQDWNGAADAYRALLRRFPSHKDAPKWRDRLNESNVAYQQTLEAKRKKAASDDPLSGSK